MLRSHGSAVYWLVPYGLLGLLFYETQGYLSRGGPINNGLGFPTLS